MSSKRGGRVPPPSPTGGWTLRFADSTSASGWEQLISQYPNATRKAFERLETDPSDRSERQHRLRGSQASTRVGGATLEQWQYEVTGGARVLYAIDPANRTVWILDASPGHPKHTERVKGQR
jgi:hypothetical protein